jgi:hypothetical protein
LRGPYCRELDAALRQKEHRSRPPQAGASGRVVVREALDRRAGRLRRVAAIPSHLGRQRGRDGVPVPGATAASRLAALAMSR